MPAANANVGLTSVRTDLATVDPTGRPGLTGTPVWTWSSSANGTDFTQGGTASTFTCPAADLSRAGSFHHLRVELVAQAAAAGGSNRASCLSIELVGD